MHRVLTLCLGLTLGLFAGTLQADLSKRSEVQVFIDQMVQKHAFDNAELERLFARTEIKQSILDAISRPAEGKPWHEYRPIFLTEDRIRKGVAFYNKYADILARAEREYGVSPTIITAILGVETRYGGYTGNYRVMDALSTLGFDYPPRSKFFRGQLEEFLLMAREESVDPLTMTGSYAGAMGQPQFIPSSFRAYAVDFNNDGRRDLWSSVEDVIGSVANYFHVHHWEHNNDVARRAKVEGEAYAPLLERGLKPSIPLAELAAHGVNTHAELPREGQAALLALDVPDGKEYWVTLNNFYVITRYNRSPLYAMAVYQLSEAIRTSIAAQTMRSGKDKG